MFVNSAERIVGNETPYTSQNKRFIKLLVHGFCILLQV